MKITRLAAFWRSLTSSTSRRGLLAPSTAGLLAARQLAVSGSESEAKKRKRNGRRKKNRKKNDRSETRIDAICSAPTDNAVIGLNEGAFLAQTFTALNSGRLLRAELPISVATSTGSADLILQLRDINASGIPTDEVFAETLVASSDVPEGQSTVSFSFTDPPAVAANREYSLVLSKRGSRVLSWVGLRDDVCDGRAFRRDSDSEPFEEPPPGDIDLIFTTIVEF